jgi:hypothetical protein
MYAYVADKQGADYEEQRKLAYWRKHPNLHGWMEQLWINKGRPGAYGTGQTNEYDVDFNGIEVELTFEDLEQLEEDILTGSLPHTTGFFFGDPRDEGYKERDLEFIKKAKAEIFCGLKVFYNSSW